MLLTLGILGAALILAGGGITAALILSQAHTSDPHRGGEQTRGSDTRGDGEFPRHDRTAHPVQRQAREQPVAVAEPPQGGRRMDRPPEAEPSLVGEWVIFEDPWVGSMSYHFQANGDFNVQMTGYRYFGGCYVYRDGRLTLHFSGVEFLKEVAYTVNWLGRDRFQTSDGTVWRRQ
jgi:hypothetical protein